jgi:hypothetical protein
MLTQLKLFSWKKNTNVILAVKMFFICKTNQYTKYYKVVYYSSEMYFRKNGNLKKKLPTKKGINYD